MMLWNYLRRSLSSAAAADVIVDSCLVFTTITINQLHRMMATGTFYAMTQTSAIESDLRSLLDNRRRIY